MCLHSQLKSKQRLNCEEMISPTKTVTLSSNNEPWITRALNEKEMAYDSGNITEAKLVQNKLKERIRFGKRE